MRPCSVVRLSFVLLLPFAFIGMRWPSYNITLPHSRVYGYPELGSKTVFWGLHLMCQACRRLWWQSIYMYGKRPKCKACRLGCLFLHDSRALGTCTLHAVAACRLDCECGHWAAKCACCWAKPPNKVLPLHKRRRGHRQGRKRSDVQCHANCWCMLLLGGLERHSASAGDAAAPA